MMCKCGHQKSVHESLNGVPQECTKCDCLVFKDNTHRNKVLSEACSWDSCEFCEDLTCEHPCHEVSRKNQEMYG